MRDAGRGRWGGGPLHWALPRLAAGGGRLEAGGRRLEARVLATSWKEGRSVVLYYRI